MRLLLLLLQEVGLDRGNHSDLDDEDKDDDDND